MKEKKEIIKKEIINKENNSTESKTDSFIKAENLENEELKRKLEYNMERLSHQRMFYEEDDNNKFAAKRHLYDHSREIMDSLINITNKDLQLEYSNEVTSLLKILIIYIVLSISVFIQIFLIIKAFKSNEIVTISLISCSFTFFLGFFLLIELYRDALRDQFRYISFRVISIFYTFVTISLFILEFWNIRNLNEKIQEREESCKKNKRFCPQNLKNNILLIFIYLNIFLIGIFLIFPIKLGFKSIKILIGCDFEVFQKQLKQNENSNTKENKDKNKDKKEDKNKIDKSKKNGKEHLKND